MMTLKELVNCCENVNDQTEVMVFKSPDDYELSTSNWYEISIEMAKELNWKIEKFRIAKYTNLLMVALA